MSNKLGARLTELSASYPVELFKDGSKVITVDGYVRARFFKDGRFFDVNLTSKAQRDREKPAS